MHTLFHSEVFHLKLYIQEKFGHMHTYLCSHMYKFIAGKQSAQNKNNLHIHHIREAMYLYSRNYLS